MKREPMIRRVIVATTAARLVERMRTAADTPYEIVGAEHTAEAQLLVQQNPFACIVDLTMAQGLFGLTVAATCSNWNVPCILVHETLSRDMLAFVQSLAAQFDCVLLDRSSLIHVVTIDVEFPEFLQASATDADPNVFVPPQEQAREERLYEALGTLWHFTDAALLWMVCENLFERFADFPSEPEEDPVPVRDEY